MNDNFLIKRGHFTPLAILLMILLPLVTALICICLGRMNVPVGDVIAVFHDVLTGTEGHAQNYSIVINLRLPRILMAIIPARETRSNRCFPIHWQHRTFSVLPVAPAWERFLRSSFPAVFWRHSSLHLRSDLPPYFLR